MNTRSKSASSRNAIRRQPPLLVAKQAPTPRKVGKSYAKTWAKTTCRTGHGANCRTSTYERQSSVYDYKNGEVTQLTTRPRCSPNIRNYAKVRETRKWLYFTQMTTDNFHQQFITQPTKHTLPISHGRRHRADCNSLTRSTSTVIQDGDSLQLRTWRHYRRQGAIYDSVSRAYNPWEQQF